ncbi:hypothetical conserved protein [Oceanobacillus iheyensis HTE831]|uniref:Hypothetical conserved protein n=1 Tax=Oceanobacillus iheyensis (strain DSM 14371 / CIP 107618 / JCM 11309 / KCTC 3954 / HTE831) TaxID=221109 RepID=Q8ELJ5_OCEIH|nr:TIM barrel protein [Oceanobacillus iheyensis]BAC15188.1 hypothetical conserved protein [Oceanobacillus iheyensis HTE831]
MTKQFSLAHLTALEYAPPELTYLASDAGYDFVSFRPIYMGLPNEPNYALADNHEMFRQTKRALENTGIKLLDIELAKIQDDIDPKAYEPAFEVGAELGGRHVLSSIWTKDRSLYMERFHELCELAKTYGLTVELEFVPIAGVSNLEGAIDVLQSVKQENAGLMIDLHHFHRSKENVEDLKTLPKEWFRYLHLCDAPSTIPKQKEELIRIMREDRSYVGDGGIDIASIVDNIPEIPYSIEQPNRSEAIRLGYPEFVKQTLIKAKNYFNKISSEDRTIRK